MPGKVREEDRRKAKDILKQIFDGILPADYESSPAEWYIAQALAAERDAEREACAVAVESMKLPVDHEDYTDYAPSGECSPKDHNDTKDAIAAAIRKCRKST